MATLPSHPALVSRARLRALLSLAAVLAILTGCTRTPAQKEARFLERGKTLAAKHDNARAILEFRSAAQVMPKDAEPYYQAALVYVAMGDAKTAVMYLEKALQFNPSHSGAQIALAKLKIQTQNRELVEDAESTMRKLAARPDANISALNVLAVSEARLGKLSDAQRDFASALEKDPRALSSAQSLAALKMYGGDRAGAEAILKRSADANPRSSQAALSLAEFYAKTGRTPEALAQAQRSVDLDSKNPKALLQLAMLQMQSGQSAQAEATYKKLSTSEDPKLKPLHAIFLFQKGDRPQAIAELRQLVAADPDNRDFRRLLVSAELENHQLQDAQRLLAEALKRNPKDIDSLLEQSAFFMNSGQLKQAEANLQTVLSFKPDSAEAHYGLAQIAARRGAPLVERQELGETLRINPALLPARIELSSLMLRSNDPKLAKQIIEDAPPSERKDVNYVLALNNALLASNDTAAVRKNLDAALASSQAPELLFQDAQLKFAARDLTASRKALEQILKTNPEHMPALNLLARTYAAQGDPGKAVTALQAYAEQKPNSPFILSVIGTWQLRAQQPEAARQSFLNAIKAAPDAVPPRLALAHLDIGTGNFAEARQMLGDVLAHDPRNTQALLQTGILEERTGQQSAARDHFRAVIDAEPGNVAALTYLAVALAAQDGDQALRYAQNAVEHAPDDPAAQDVLGWIYYKKGLADAALSHFQAAVSSQPTAIRRYHLALAYAKLGDEKLAHENLTAALRLNPNLRMPEPLPNSAR